MLVASEPLKVFLHVPHNEVPGNTLVPLVADPAQLVGVVLVLLMSRAQAGRTRGPLSFEVSTNEIVHESFQNILRRPSLC